MCEEKRGRGVGDICMRRHAVPETITVSELQEPQVSCLIHPIRTLVDFPLFRGTNSLGYWKTSNSKARTTFFFRDISCQK